MISANGGLPAHRYTPQVTPRWPRGSELASKKTVLHQDQGGYFPWTPLRKTRNRSEKQEVPSVRKKKKGPNQKKPSGSVPPT